MGQPSSWHYDARMSNVSLLYKNEEYQSHRIFLDVPVAKQSDRYTIYPAGAWFRDEAGIRAPGTRGTGGGFPISTAAYHCTEKQWWADIPDEDRRNADAPLDPDIDKTEFATQKVLLKRERESAALCLAASGTWTDAIEDAEGNWGHATEATDTFLTDVTTRIKTIQLRTGKTPNVLGMDYGTYQKISLCPKLQNLIKYTQPGPVGPGQIANLLNIQEVVVCGGVYSTAQEKLDATDMTGQYIWEVNSGKGSAVLLYRPPRPGIRTAAAGYFFVFEKRAVRRWREDGNKADYVEAFESYDCKAVGSGLGFAWSDTIVT